MMVGSDYSQDSSVAFSFVQTTCSRSGGFSRDWADLAGATLHWVGRNVLSVCDFTISKEFYMEISMLQEVTGDDYEASVHDAVRGEVRLRRIKCYYFEVNYSYEFAVTPEVPETWHDDS